jgi:SAM-dependent methyltransferase
MTNINNQVDYWDKVAQDKVFTHPINLPLLHKYLPLNSRILDYGCGYGRVCQELAQNGYTNLIGVDSSAEMIQRGRQMNPTLQLEVLSSSGQPDPDHLFDAILLIAVLTCIPTDEGQQNLIAFLKPILRPGGLLYISDYLLQDDERNQQRYRSYLEEFGAYGVFRLPEGAILRHHSTEWILSLTNGFNVLDISYPEVITMNGNKAKAIQLLGQTSN